MPETGETGTDVAVRVARLEALVDMLASLTLAVPSPEQRVLAAEFEALRTNDELAGVGYDAVVAGHTDGHGFYPCCHCGWVGTYRTEPEPCEGEAQAHLAVKHGAFIREHPEQGRVLVWERDDT